MQLEIHRHFVYNSRILYLVSHKNASLICGGIYVINEMKYEPHGEKDVILITGIGSAFPFMRIHKLLNAIQPYFSNMPIFVLYPGEYDGHELRLFNCLKANPYYRAFNIK